MILKPEDVASIAADVTLHGLPACHPWSAVLEIGAVSLGVVLDDAGLTLTDEVGINSSWDFGFTVSEQEWEAFCARPVGRGQLVEMPGKGHFPMSEDPVGFAEHLFPVLDLLHPQAQRQEAVSQSA